MTHNRTPKFLPDHRAQRLIRTPPAYRLPLRPGPGDCKVRMSDALDGQPYGYNHGFQVHADESVSDIEAGVGLD